jgi:hypothetical protein
VDHVHVSRQVFPARTSGASSEFPLQSVYLTRPSAGQHYAGEDEILMKKLNPSFHDEFIFLAYQATGFPTRR